MSVGKGEVSMQTKITVTLALGFVMGLGFASCASMESGRTVASDSNTRYAAPGDRPEDKNECQVGEERNENGDCARPFNFDRPFRKGGR